ncbi:MAG TPA: hypothetical protein VN493_19005 [Thermoanaerobaculia bacterium]|nr:hypothetical protein [Thermoanaerobaculia bacterium]
MKIRSIASLLLLLVGLGLFLGPHPCHAAEETPAPEPQASCHEETPVPDSEDSSGEPDCCGKGHRGCEMVCQAAAGVLAGSSATLNLQFERLAAPSVQGALRLFVLSIDHVPLA